MGMGEEEQVEASLVRRGRWEEETCKRRGGGAIYLDGLYIYIISNDSEER